MAQLSAPKKEAWARHLREADRLAKQKLYAEAIRELEQALEIDPKDMYARSYLERVRTQWNRKQEEAKAAEEDVQTSFDERMELIPKLLSASERLMQEKDYKAALREIAKVYKIDPNNYYARAHSDRIEELMMEEEQKKTQRGVKVREHIEQSPETGDTIFYKELLREYWFDGKLTPDEEGHLASVRTTFGISDDDHVRLSKEVKFDAYVDALRIAWIDGVISETERRTLEFMRNKYAITPQENARAEAQVQTLRKEKPDRERIVIVDGVKEHALSMTKVLKKHGFNTMLTPHPAEALKLLDHVTPKAVVMALRYEGSDMDGFELYRRIKLYPPLLRVPVFLSMEGDDKDVVHAAIRLGVDHVVKRPVDPEFIVAVLRGREAREEQLLL